MSQTLEQLKKIIIEANPEIMEKKTGCWINWGGAIKHISMIVMQNDKGNYTVWDEEKISNVRYNWINKILGRDITLSDVLLAIDKNCVNEGRFWEQYKPIVEELVYNLWNLRKNSLDWHAKNKPETINFLSEILCQKK